MKERTETTYREEQRAKVAFRGYAPPTSSTTYTPNQFFDVVIPHASRGCLRLVAYLIRKTLGWSDEFGNPQNPEAYVSYRELIERAGISRGAIKEAIDEALEKRFIQCLRFGQPHRPKEEGFSALYSLKWDERQSYVVDPVDFDGFFAGNGNLTHIPNDFFDYTVPNEPLGVVQVIGVIIRNTIGWQTKFGFRRQQVELSFSDIMRRTGINSRTTVSNALKAAIDGCHIMRVEHGVFDTNAGIGSKATVYAVRWSDGKVTDQRTPVVESSQMMLFEPDEAIGSKYGPGDQSKKWTEEDTVQKVDRDSTVQNMDWRDSSESGPANGSESEPATVQEVDSEEFKKRTAIKTTTINNPSKQHQQTGPDVVGGSKSLALLMGKLMAEGIEAATAARLVDAFPAEQIERQLIWIGLREVKASRTGLLIRAIERDMPMPGVQTSERSSGWLFASHFYAELAGNVEEPTAEPSSEDIRLSGAFLIRLANSKAPEQLGRNFAGLVKGREKGKPTPIRTLSLSLRLYGDEFYRSHQVDAKAAVRKAQETAKAEHLESLKPVYEDFREQIAKGLEDDADFMVAFDEDSARKVKKAYQLSPTAGRRREEAFASPEGRIEAILEFATSTGKAKVLSFWEWDATINETPFSTEGS